MLQVDISITVKDVEWEKRDGTIKEEYITMYVPGADNEFTIANTAAAMIRFVVEQYKAAVYEKQRNAEKEQES